jgi:hypothetical protein
MASFVNYSRWLELCGWDTIVCWEKNCEAEDIQKCSKAIQSNRDGEDNAPSQPCPSHSDQEAPQTRAEAGGQRRGKQSGFETRQKDAEYLIFEMHRGVKRCQE